MIEPNENHYLAIDPGHTSGWATFDQDGVFRAWGQLAGLDDLDDFLLALSPKPCTVIVEEYRLYKSKAIQQSGSKLETVQAIGVIKTHARRWKAAVIEQRADIKAIAEKWSGHSAKGIPHSQSHKVDAMNHGTYFLVKNHIIQVKI